MSEIRFIKYFGLILLVSIPLVLFNNCSNVEFEEVDTDTAKSDTPQIEISPPEEPPSDQPINNLPGEPTNEQIVVDRCQTNARFSKETEVFFPKPNATCDWGSGGNLAPRNLFFQARIEQSRSVDLPPNSIICDVSFQFEEQQMLYDDQFLMTFNDFVLASTYDFSEVLSADEGGYLEYDWSQIAGMPWENGAGGGQRNLEGVFCAQDGEQSTCSWPKTDVPGEILMSFSPTIFQSIMAKDLNRFSHELKFVSIGDNDELDCEHSDLRFSLTVSYVMPE